MMRARLTLCSALLLSAACYSTHDDALTAASVAAANVRSTPAPAQPAAGGRIAYLDGGTTPYVPSAPPVDASTAAAHGGGGCGALRPEGSVSADTREFSGVGGAGFDLVAVCDRCGWNHTSDECKKLVYTVPTIDEADYSTCFTETFKFTTCVTSERCICDHELPEACVPVQADLDACRRTAHAQQNQSQ
jgi:hypothetical protein